AIGDLLRGDEELGGLVVRHAKDQGAVLGVGGEGVVGGGQRADREVLRGRDGAGSRSVGGGLAGARVREDEGQEGLVVVGRVEGRVTLGGLPLPGGLRPGAEAAAALDERGPVGGAYIPAQVQQA